MHGQGFEGRIQFTPTGGGRSVGGRWVTPQLHNIKHGLLCVEVGVEGVCYEVLSMGRWGALILMLMLC